MLGVGYGIANPFLWSSRWPPRYAQFGGVLHQLLTDGSGYPLMGADGLYLYGVAQ